MHNGTDIKTIPATFRDAAVFPYSLGLWYISIDALSIFQDSPEGDGGMGRNTSVNDNSFTMVPVRRPVTESQTVHSFLATIQR
jgi:hypothetical protein